MVASLLFELHREQETVLVIATHNVELAGRCSIRYRLRDRRARENRGVSSGHLMTILTLLRRSLRHFWQTNLAVVAGVTVAVAVLAGALLVGTSVRASLRDLALERLGAVDQVVTSGSFVREALADDLLAPGTMPQMFDAAAPLIEVEGFVTHQESGRRASAIRVYGVDDRFWDFHGRAPEGRGPERRDVLISQGLARELEAEVDHTLLIRVEMPSAIPISSLHGRREDASRSLRLRIAHVLDPEDLGEFSFRPHQGLARFSLCIAHPPAAGTRTGRSREHRAPRRVRLTSRR